MSAPIVIVGDGAAFTPGTAAGNYVGLIRRGLVAAGMPCELSEEEVSALGRARRAGRRLARLARLGGVVGRPSLLVYYGHSALSLLVLRLASWARRVPLVVHVVEWPEAHPSRGLAARCNVIAFTALVFRAPDAAIVISSYLEERAGARCPTIRVPILVDVSAWSEPPLVPAGTPYVLFCADLDGYRHDALLLVDAVAALDASPVLRMVGRASDESAAVILGRATGRVDVRLERRHVPDDELRALYSGAIALLAPLRHDDRSRARFPSKLADYLLAARPVVSTAVGEVANLLEDGVTGYLATGDDVTSFAAALQRALDDPRADAVGQAGRERAAEVLDHVVHGERLAVFLRALGRRRR